MNSLLAILDIGKSNARLMVIDPVTELPVYTARRSNRGIDGPPLRQLDIAGLKGWLLDSLAACPERACIGCIVPVAHGAACVMLDGKGEVVLAPDYEDPIHEQHDGYTRQRDDFAETLSPGLPLGLNLGRQIFTVEQRLPGHYRRVERILTYPQYWAWLLSGVAASEITSLGCHTDLWSPARADFSPLARNRGWDRKFPGLRAADDELGSLRPAIADRCGLDPGCRVLCGIHDSNASYLRHRMHRAKTEPFSVISSGTWTVILASNTDVSNLRQDRDMLGNVDAFGSVVGTARFMGGREYEAVAGAVPGAGCGAAVPDLASLGRVLAGPALVEPGFTAGGQFPGCTGRIDDADGLDPSARAALATLHIALLSDNALNLLDASGDIVIDGPLGKNAIYPSILAALRPDSRVLLGLPDTGTTGGALCLALGAQAQPPVLRIIRSDIPIPGLDAHVRRWRRHLSRQAATSARPGRE